MRGRFLTASMAAFAMLAAVAHDTPRGEVSGPAPGGPDRDEKKRRQSKIRTGRTAYRYAMMTPEQAAWNERIDAERGNRK